jgi:hypothetical protein
VRRFADRDRFTSYNGTAPIEVSSGGHEVFRLSRRGNRRLNHAVHMAAVTQVSHRASEGRAYYDRKLKEGKTHKEALRCLKRRISDAIFAHLVADAKRKAQAGTAGPGGQRGNGSVSSVAGSHPERQLFGQATPRPVPTLRRTASSRGRDAHEPARKKSRKASWRKEVSMWLDSPYKTYNSAIAHNWAIWGSSESAATAKLEGRGALRSRRGRSVFAARPW